jgi:hypothetical protein
MSVPRMQFKRNVDRRVAEGFGREWSTFTQGSSDLTPNERQRPFDQYFRIFPWNDLPANAEVHYEGEHSLKIAFITAGVHCAYPAAFK